MVAMNPSPSTADTTSDARMRWWHEARFGMFVHWGLYSQLGQYEWAMNLDRIPVSEYEPLADSWQPKPGAAREWAALAKAAGMKYMVLTTKHHEGFCLWDTRQTEYNAVKRGPKRDLIREYVEACREFGLKVGFYYSLMDWHHPDGHECQRDEAARRRFLDFTQGCLRELMSNYGEISILWYDVGWPLDTPERWESVRMNGMVRELQPGIIINDRALLPEDFTTPEGHITAAPEGRAWEACMCTHPGWGWRDAPAEDWVSARSVIGMLAKCAGGGGNLLLNIGPKPDGTVGSQAVQCLRQVGHWLERHGEAVYAASDRVERLGNVMDPNGDWTHKGNTYYHWIRFWRGGNHTIGRLRGELLHAEIVGTEQPLRFTQERDRLILHDLPATCPDPVAAIAVLRLTFRQAPVQVWHGLGCEYMEGFEATDEACSSYLTRWEVSAPVARPAAGVSACEPPAAQTAWTELAQADGFVNVHDRYPEADGIVYLRTRVRAEKTAAWNLLLGHDGGVRLFLDGRPIHADPEQKNPAIPTRSRIPVQLAAGEHELMAAFDLNGGRGWGIYLRFAAPAGTTKPGEVPQFPRVVTPDRTLP